MTKHLAALALEKGALLSTQARDTPEPGPNDVLIEVKALAFNPVDYYQRDMGLPPVPSYPAVFGSDVAGIVAKVGANVAEAALPLGTRVLAFASSFFQSGRPEYGAFQQYTLAQSEAVVAIPDNISFEQAASMPMAVSTALTAFTCIGIPLSTKFLPAEKQAILIWGASSSVGTMAVQSAKSLGFFIYATASSKHHAYIKQLGADAVFDYKDRDVVSQIVKAVHEDATKLHTVHCVVNGGLQPSLDVLEATKGSAPGFVAHSPILPEGHPVLVNTLIKFNFPPEDARARDAHIADCFQGWLAKALQTGAVVPSPPVDVVGNGLESVNKALDLVKAGVSCKKVVVLL